MRIIAGDFRGRRLLPPESQTTRPITDRVKQSVFDILSPLIDGAAVYDCFAGTGSMGLECISRGAASATFFEADRSAIKRLQANIDTLRVNDRCRIVSGDIFKWFPAFENSHGRSGETGLVFLDPPYRLLREKPDDLKRLAKLIALHHLGPKGILIFRHALEDRLELLPTLLSCDERNYGGMSIEFLERANESKPNG